MSFAQKEVYFCILKVYFAQKIFPHNAKFYCTKITFMNFSWKSPKVQKIHPDSYNLPQQGGNLWIFSFSSISDQSSSKCQVVELKCSTQHFTAYSFVYTVCFKTHTVLECIPPLKVYLSSIYMQFSMCTSEMCRLFSAAWDQHENEHILLLPCK